MGFALLRVLPERLLVKNNIDLKPYIKKPMKEKIKIVYIEDLRIVREAVNFLLSHQENLEIIDEVPDPERMQDFINRNRPDVVIVDLQLATPGDQPSSNGFHLAEKIHGTEDSIKLIAHTMYDSIENVNKFFEIGGHGFVSKKSGHLELLNAIATVMEGKKYLCNSITKETKNAERFIKGDDQQLKAVHEIFTKTEKNILQRISKGYSTKQIAHQLGISEKTVETHRKHLFDKAGVKNVAELIAFVFSRRIVME
jgi:DNA-binding NarL/FixJ family response regulator